MLFYIYAETCVLYLSMTVINPAFKPQTLHGMWPHA